MGSKINYFQGSIALCHTGSIARGFSSLRKITKNVLFVLQKCTFRFGDYIRDITKFIASKDADSLVELIKKF